VSAAPDVGLTRDEVAEVLHRHRRALEGLGVTLLRNVAAAQDAVQDAIEAILKVRTEFASEAGLLAYARKSVVNRCHSANRRASVANRYLGRFLDPPAPAADEAILLADEHQRLLRCFYRLPQRQRESLALRHFADLDDREIADVLQITRVAVRSNISRGLAALRRLLEEEQ
jgi:RNA polymerase sigma factor (sigma-70 family)